VVWGSNNPLARYGAAIAAVAVSLLARSALAPILGEAVPFITLFPAVAVVALYGGVWPGIVTTLIGGVAAGVVVMDPALSFHLTEPKDVVQIAIFISMGTLMSWAVGERRRFQTKLERVETESEQKMREARDALRLSEERSNLAEAAIGLGVWEWDVVADRVSWSDGIYTLLGLPLDSEDVGLAAWSDLIIPEDREAAMNNIRSLIDEGAPNFYGEFRVKRRNDGRVRWLATQGKIIRENGKATGLLGVNYDITETKRSELKIQELNKELSRRVRELRTIIELTPVGIAVAEDASCDVIIANPALAEMVGLKSGDNVSLNDGKLPYRHLRRGRELQPHELPMQRAVEERRPILDEEIEIELGDGTRVIIYGYAAPVFDEAGNVISCVAAQIDITERKKYELERERKLSTERGLRKQAEEANRLKDEFLATVSHELRTPLNAIVGWVAVLHDKTLPEDIKRRAIDAIERGARSQSQLIEDLLDVSRIISGKLQISSERVELAPVIWSALDTVRPGAEAKKIEIRADLAEDPVCVTGDDDRLQQIVWNLLSNAIKFTPTGGRVEVKLIEKHGLVSLTVSDTGRGITKEFLPYVFDRFRQADGSITRQFSGLGLGLAIVRHLVELHGGSVRVDSDGQDHGSNFTVELPAAVPSELDRMPAAVENGDGERPRFAGSRVLIVDDEQDTRDILKLTFELYEADVEVAGSADEAIQKVRDWNPTLIVSDVGMPERDGYEFIRDVRKWEAGSNASPTPSIALTAYAAPADRTRALAAGFTSHVAKPVEPIELARIAGNLLDGHKEKEL